MSTAALLLVMASLPMGVTHRPKVNVTNSTLQNSTLQSARETLRLALTFGDESSGDVVAEVGNNNAQVPTTRRLEFTSGDESSGNVLADVTNAEVMQSSGTRRQTILAGDFNGENEYKEPGAFERDAQWHNFEMNYENQFGNDFTKSDLVVIVCMEANEFKKNYPDSDDSLTDDWEAAKKEWISFDNKGCDQLKNPDTGFFTDELATILEIMEKDFPKRSNTMDLPDDKKQSAVEKYQRQVDEYHFNKLLYFGKMLFKEYMTSWFQPFKQNRWSLATHDGASSPSDAEFDAKFKETRTSYFGGRPGWFLSNWGGSTPTPIPIVIPLTTQAFDLGTATDDAKAATGNIVSRPGPTSEEKKLMEQMHSENTGYPTFAQYRDRVTEHNDRAQKLPASGYGGSITDNNAIVTKWIVGTTPLVVMSLNMQFWKWASVPDHVTQPPQHKFVTPTDVRHMRVNLHALLNCDKTKLKVGDHEAYVKWPQKKCTKIDYVLIQEGLHDLRKLGDFKDVKVGERIEYRKPTWNGSPGKFFTLGNGPLYGYVMKIEGESKVSIQFGKKKTMVVSTDDLTHGVVLHTGVAHLTMRQLGFELVKSSGERDLRCDNHPMVHPGRAAAGTVDPTRSMTQSDSVDCSASVDVMSHFSHDKDDWNLGFKLTNEIWRRKLSRWKPEIAQVNLISNPALILPSDNPTPRSMVRAIISSEVAGGQRVEVELLTAHVAGGRFDDQFFALPGMWKERRGQTQKIIDEQGKWSSVSFELF